MKKDTLLQEGNIEVVISGPLKLILGRKVSITHYEGITIKDVINHISDIYKEKTGKGHNKFEELMKQLVIYVDGRKWDKKSLLKLDKDSRVDIVHIINGG